jgi:hypothetical protein
MEFLDEALAQLARGRALLPVDHAKRPASRAIHRTRGRFEWAPLRNDPAGEDELREWCEHDQVAGIATITGEPSRLAVVDVDDPAAAPELPPSAYYLTRRGRHVEYQCDEPTRSRTYQWGELKAEGTYAVAPPTPGYLWEVSPEEIGGLVDFSRARALLTPICSTCFIDRGSRARVSLPSELALKDPAAAFANFDRDEHAALRMAAALGAPEGLRLGQGFGCLIHQDRNPSASLWRWELDAHILYKDWHSGSHGERPWLTLATVRARLAGRRGQLAAPERSMWKRRLVFEADLFEPAPVTVEADPPPEQLKAVWDGFLLLLALRWVTDPGGPAPFTVRFAAAWCGVSTRQAHEQLAELARRRFLRLCGTDPRGTRLWLPAGVVMPPS